MLAQLLLTSADLVSNLSVVYLEQSINFELGMILLLANLLAVLLNDQFRPTKQGMPLITIDQEIGLKHKEISSRATAAGSLVRGTPRMDKPWMLLDIEGQRLTSTKMSLPLTPCLQ